MKILITPRSFAKQDKAPLRLLEAKGFEIVRNETGGIMSEKQLKSAIEGCGGVIIGVDPLTADVMCAAPNLAAVAKYGVGTDNIDMAYCEKTGIRVSKTTGANSDAVADYAFSLMLALARKVIRIDAECRRGNWTKITTLDVAHKTLGLIGLGAIGRNMVARAKGFSMNVLAYDLYWDEDYANEHGVTYAEIDEICAKSDFISLHLPLLKDTENIIDARRLGLMKREAFLINTARGGLIDDDALLSALRTGRIGGAGLDVFKIEPPEDDAWLDLDNVILGSHCAAATGGATNNMGLMSVSNLIKDIESAKGEDAHV
jgi:D-3-phosphoglycerate dehydrogenase